MKLFEREADLLWRAGDETGVNASPGGAEAGAMILPSPNGSADAVPTAFWL